MGEKAVNAIRKAYEKREEEISNLESRSKKLSELVVTEKFLVNEVTSESSATSFTPHSEMIYGGRSPVYRGGYTSHLVLKVSPDNKDISIEVLTFDGLSIVKSGDHISAQIPRYRETKISRGLHSGPFDRDSVFYLDRDFNPGESAIELTILSEDGKVLRQDRAINYKRFVKE